MRKIISALLVCSIAFIFCIGVSAADFTMNSEKFNVKASDILAIEGVLTTDPAQYERNAAAYIGTNDADNVPEDIKGQMFLHGGKGDTYTFTVDFTGYAVSSLTYSGYGLSDPVTFEISADGTKLGSGTVNGGNGWADADSSVWENGKLSFSSPITGVVTLTVKVTDSSAAWPANAFGNFNFIGTADQPGSSPVTSDTCLIAVAAAVISVSLAFVTLRIHKAENN